LLLESHRNEAHFKPKSGKLSSGKGPVEVKKKWLQWKTKKAKLKKKIDKKFQSILNSSENPVTMLENFFSCS
jgi:hypothetical protein